MRQGAAGLMLIRLLQRGEGDRPAALPHNSPDDRIGFKSSRSSSLLRRKYNEPTMTSQMHAQRTDTIFTVGSHGFDGKAPAADAMACCLFF